MKPGKKSWTQEPISPELGALNDGPVDVVRGEAGAAFFAPVTPGAVRRLSSSQQDRLAELQDHALQLEHFQAHLDDLVLEARSAGLSWAVIGWSVGLTAEGARGRWGERDTP
ncbi:hypothetical protein [Actinotalea subterranea]|uniref:hypothetical protein n=1 Tax=Actinotalea subterranea TaxID=2607497 RepID=UPI0011EF333B|nr:hypothetical protein [Actinotalea subterranea]